MKSEIVVVGSGGATLAKELAAHGKQVMVLERGSYGGSSVLPKNAGLPPMLTIMALAKRLSKRLIN